MMGVGKSGSTPPIQSVEGTQSFSGKEDSRSEVTNKSGLTELSSSKRSSVKEDVGSSADSKAPNAGSDNALWQPYLSLDNKARAAIRKASSWPVAHSDDFMRFEEIRKSSGIQPCAMKVGSPAVSTFTANLMDRARGRYPELGFNPGQYFTVAAEINGKWHALDVKTGKSQNLADGEYIYVRMTTGELRVSNGVKNGNNGHGQLAGYAWVVAAAGHLIIKKNQIKEYNISSGTYQPLEELHAQAAMPEQANYITLEMVETLKALSAKKAKDAKMAQIDSNKTSTENRTATAQALAAESKSLEQEPPQAKKPEVKTLGLLRERSATSEQNLLKLATAFETKRSRTTHDSSNQLPEHEGENTPVPVVIDLDRRINP